jgi:hypothetical protein
VIDPADQSTMPLLPPLAPDGTPAPAPIRLSPSDAKIIITRTPLHCWANKRQLGGLRSEGTDATEDGKILEALIFNATHQFEVLPFDDYRTGAAKQAKAECIAKGKIPIKQADLAAYSDAAMAMLKGIHAANVKFSNGTPQAEVIWTSDGVECHAYLDYLVIGPDYYVIYDLKCVVDASPDKVIAAMTNYGWDIQAAACVEGVETMYPHLAGRGVFRDIFCEKSAPYAVNVPPLSGGFMELGRRKWNRAKGIWRECLASDIWPGYNNQPIEPLPWQMSKEPEPADTTQEEE